LPSPEQAALLIEEGLGGVNDIGLLSETGNGVDLADLSCVAGDCASFPEGNLAELQV